MMTDLWRRKLLFKIKTQPGNSSNGHGGDERHNTVDRSMENKTLIQNKNTTRKQQQ